VSRSLEIPDALYEQLELAAHHRGLSNIEQLLTGLMAPEEETARRRQAVQRIDQLRARLTATYGEMPDSVEMIRADRER